MHWDEREFPDAANKPDRPRNWIDRLARAGLGLLLICAAVGAFVIVGGVSSCSMRWLLSHAAAAEPDDVLLIVNGEGTTIMRCQSPVDYWIPDKAIVCIEPPVYRDGFEP